MILVQSGGGGGGDRGGGGGGLFRVSPRNRFLLSTLPSLPSTISDQLLHFILQVIPSRGSYWSSVLNGDRIRIDIPNRTLDVLVDEAELDVRKASFEPLPPRYSRGVLAKYAKLVGSASKGAVTG